jgi:hypothetical protein
LNLAALLGADSSAPDAHRARYRHSKNSGERDRIIRWILIIQMPAILIP